MNENPQPSLPPEFVQRLTRSQSALYAYVVGLLGGAENAFDVLQETNLKLCLRAASYDASQPFLRWAYGFARYEAMAWRKRQLRSRLVLDDDLLAVMAEEMEGEAIESERELTALETCLGRLPSHHRELIQARYFLSEPIPEIARRMDRANDAVSALIYRIRQTLLACVQAALRREGLT
jgi:RNA polymerase sigma-70 factor (ECF subfamily)